MSTYLENAKKTFLSPPQNLIYEGQGLKAFENFLKLLGYVIPNKINAEELNVYLTFLVNDIRNQNLGFHNSKEYKKIFKLFEEETTEIDKWLSYLPNFLKRVTPKEFYQEFIPIFKNSFYELSVEDTEEDYGYIEIEPDVIDISNKNKADVLAALYNHAKPVGMGVVQYDPTPINREIAEKILKQMGYNFSYLKGRPIKISLEDDIIVVWAYNRDNDEDGLAQRAIATCPNIKKKAEKKPYQKEYK